MSGGHLVTRTGSGGLRRLKAWLTRWRFIREGHAWHGLQLAASILVAYAAARGLGLLEGYWAAMSALIVGRADSSATLSAGWQRLAATLSGAVVGVCGVALTQALGATPEFITLGLVATLTFATADRIGWRSASIAALIVVTASGTPGTSVLAVAGLRTAEVGIGACAAMLMAWLAHRLSITTRPVSVVSALLHQLAEQIEAAVDATPEARIAHGAAIRATQRRLGEMVHGTRDMRRRMLFLLTLRLAQDVGWLARQVSESSGHREVEARAVAMDASDGLRAVATQLDGAGGDSRAALASLSRHMGAAWQADAVLVLQSDLHKLVQLTAASARGAT